MIHGQRFVGQVVRGVHEDPQQNGSTCTPIVATDHEDIDNALIIGMDKCSPKVPATLALFAGSKRP